MSETLASEQDQYTVGRRGLKIPLIDNPETPDDVGSFFWRLYKLNGVESKELFVPSESNRPLVGLRGDTFFTEPETPGDLVSIVRYYPGGISGPYNESKTTYANKPVINYRGESNILYGLGLMDDIVRYEGIGYGSEDMPSFEDRQNIEYLYSRAVVRAALKECVELLS